MPSEHGLKEHSAGFSGEGELGLGHGSRAVLQWAAGHFALICFMRSTFYTHLAALTPVSAPVFLIKIIPLTIQLRWFFLPFPQT